MKLGRMRLAEIFADRLSDSSISTAQLSQEIAAYLLAEGRTSDLDSLMRDIMQIRADQGLVEVEALTAHPLSLQEKQNIETLVRSQQSGVQTVIISETIDKQVMGGVKLSFANEQWDLSVRAQLNRFKQLTAA